LVSETVFFERQRRFVAQMLKEAICRADVKMGKAKLSAFFDFCSELFVFCRFLIAF